MDFRDHSVETDGLVVDPSSSTPAGVKSVLTGLAYETLTLAALTVDDWLASSSRDLHCGVRVSETPMDTLPGDLQEEFLVSVAS